MGICGRGTGSFCKCTFKTLGRLGRVLGVKGGRTSRQLQQAGLNMSSFAGQRAYSCLVTVWSKPGKQCCLKWCLPRAVAERHHLHVGCCECCCPGTMPG